MMHVNRKNEVWNGMLDTLCNQLSQLSLYSGLGGGAVRLMLDSETTCKIR